MHLHKSIIYVLSFLDGFEWGEETLGRGYQIRMYTNGKQKKETGKKREKRSY